MIEIVLNRSKGIILDNISTEEMVINREYLVDKQIKIVEYCRDYKGLYLHLGCGRYAFEGFLNIDKYCKEHSRIVDLDLMNLGFSSNSIDFIYNNHVIEHLPITHSYEALKEWYRV